MSVNDCSYFFIGEFNPYCAFLLNLGRISSSFEFPGADIFNGEVKMVWVIDGTGSNPSSQRFSKAFCCEWQFGGDGVEHVADLLFCLLKFAELDGVDEVLLGGWL